MYCLCGCGKITNIAKRTGRVLKGQHYKFIAGHQNRGNNRIDKGYGKLIEESKNKYLCQCGCGEYIKVEKFHLYRNYIPKYIHGHYIGTPQAISKTIQMNKQRVGSLSPRWKENRDDIRGRKRCKVDFTKSQKRDIYVRDNGICQECGMTCLIDVNINHPWKVNIDHIVSVENGGINEISNGQVLCLSCHKFKHSAIAKSANSEKAKAKAMPTPNQAEQIIALACVETNGHSSKEMI